MSEKKKKIENIAEFSEPVIDHLSSNLIKPLAGSLSDVVKDEPALKIVLKLLQLPQSISDAMFLHKFNKFFVASKLTENDLRKLNKKLTGKKKSRLWKLIFTSIQSHDDEIRSELVGKVVTALSKGNITPEEAIRMIHASNRVNVENLDYLRNSYLGNPGSMPGYARQEFVTVGLLSVDESKIGTWGGGGPTYPLNDFGARYVGAIFDYPPYPHRKDIKLGKERLINSKKNISESHHTILPFKEVQDKHYWYGEAALVVREGNKILLLNRSPVVISAPIFSGEYGERALSKVTGIKEENLSPVFIRNDEARHVTVHYYLADAKMAKKIIIEMKYSWADYGDLIRNNENDELKGLSNAILRLDAVLEEEKRNSEK